MFASSLLAAQTTAASPPPTAPAAEYSGMYSFLKEGEFVQLTVEEGRVTGFVSRYGEQESDQGAFLDQKLSFTPQTVHGVYYEFKGAIERGEGKNVGDEAYYVLKGKLTQYTTNVDKKTSSQSRDVTLKAFPADLGNAPAKP